MTAGKGWISDPPPTQEREWKTPGWVKGAGEHFVSRSGVRDEKGSRESPGPGGLSVASTPE